MLEPEASPIKIDNHLKVIVCVLNYSYYLTISSYISYKTI